jgi:hypothetical protein
LLFSNAGGMGASPPHRAGVREADMTTPADDTPDAIGRDGEREPAAASAVAIPGALHAHPHDDTPHAISTITAIPC